jgi:hypothetical protein
MIPTIILLLAVLGAWLYRAGGQGKPYNTKYRDIGVSLVIIAQMCLSGQINSIPAYSALIPCFLLMWGSLSTYRYFLPKPKDYLWYHYALHGFFVSLSIFPIMFFAFSWIGFIARVIICAALISLWSHFITNDVWEERGRGFIFCITTFIL